MTEKIKSIKFKQEVIQEMLKTKNSFTDEIIELAETNPAYFEIEYEKPKILKRGDGSIISELKEGVEILVIASNGYELYILKDTFSYKNIISLKSGEVFLAKDRHLAEKKKEMLKKQLEIRFEIDRLNAEGYNNEAFNLIQDYINSNLNKDDSKI